MKGAFGEVRLVRMRERFSKEIYAMKSMLKEAMIMKVRHGVTYDHVIGLYLFDIFVFIV